MLGCGASSAKPGAVASPAAAAAKKDDGKPKPVAGANLPPSIVKKIPEKPVKPAVPRPDDEPDWDVEEYALGLWEDEMVPCQIVKSLGENWYMVHFIGDEDDDLEKLHDDDLIDIPEYEVGDWMWGLYDGEWEGCVVVGVNDNDTYTVHFDSDDLDDNTEDFPAHCLMYDDGEESDE